ncbi:MAG: hypothetical protein AB1546_10055, partial [bacterium]
MSCLFAVLLLTPACQKKPESTEGGTASKFKSPDAFREYLRDKIICPADGLTLNQCAKYNPECPMGKKMNALVERMIKEGWSETDVEDAVSLLAQGRPAPVESIADAKPCPGPDGNLRLDLFIMSQCPYGFRFINGALSEL